MSSTYISLHYHLVFGTKGREAFIVPEWRLQLHDYLGGTLRNLGGFPECIGGVADHVPLLVGLKATHCLANVMRALKKDASVWVHRTVGLKHFAWQEGYAAFTVSATSREGVRRYIANQEEHHRTQSFNDELTNILSKAEAITMPE